MDFDLDYVPMSTVDGHVAVPDGSRVQLTLATADSNAPYQTNTSATVGGDGRFTFRRVPPGHYLIAARAFSMPAPGTSALAAILWGRTEVLVAGDDIEGVGIALEPGLTLAGDLVFEGATTPPTLNGFKLPLQVRSLGNAGISFPTSIVEGSQIVVRGAVPGLYQYPSPPQGIRTRVGPWWLESITMDDREVLDRPLEILPNTKTLRVTFSDRASQLSGVVTDRDGTPVTDSYVVVFSEDEKTWFHHSRRVAAVQPDSQGRFTVSNLPAGNYFLAVSSDLENNEWF
ncbi:MAG: carboxypeptidase-like regulatory domain-containing protein, partial [Acidobacteriota bacterium]|nr:carboxypeptidase-like regulatory domain-containing protein [Acidobacteriota bacterium]